VISGNPTPETIERCEGYGAICVPKGPELWDTVQAELIEIFPAIWMKCCLRCRNFARWT